MDNETLISLAKSLSLDFKGLDHDELQELVLEWLPLDVPYEATIAYFNDTGSIDQISDAYIGKFDNHIDFMTSCPEYWAPASLSDDMVHFFDFEGYFNYHLRFDFMVLDGYYFRCI